MVRADRCCVGPCDNDKRCPKRLVVMKHVERLKWHRFPTKDEDRKKKWASLVAKGRCKPTNKNPSPVLYLTLDD